MASSTAHTIVLRSNNPDNAMQRTREALAGEAGITPGMLLEWSGADLLKHNSAAGDAEAKKVAIENPWSDHGSGAAIAHAYADNETVFYIHALPGDQFYMWLADGENAAKGAALGSDGDGALDVLTVDVSLLEGAIVGYAAEAVDNSAGGAVARIRVDIA